MNVSAPTFRRAPLLALLLSAMVLAAACDPPPPTSPPPPTAATIRITIKTSEPQFVGSTQWSVLDASSRVVATGNVASASLPASREATLSPGTYRLYGTSTASSGPKIYTSASCTTGRPVLVSPPSSPGSYALGHEVTVTTGMSISCIVDVIRDTPVIAF